MSETSPESPDFDTFLATLASDDNDQQEVERVVKERGDRLWEELALSDVPHLIDSVPAEQDRQEAEAISDVIARLRTEGDALDEDSLRNRALEEVRLRVGDEIFIFHLIAMVRGFAEDDTDPGQIEHDKKWMIATLMVRKHLEFTNPWITFANRTVPGAAFDPQDPDDEMYILKAIEEESERDAEQTREAEISDKLAELIDADSEEPDADMLVSKLIHAAITEGRGRDNGDAERRSQLDALLRKHGIVGEQAESIVAFLETSFPLPPID